MKVINASVLSLGLLLGQFAFSHGENKPGPHKGYIRMPGAFHTEVVPVGNSKFKIYLLDIEWKNPSVQNSKLEVKHLGQDRAVEVQCDQKSDHFSCALPKGLSLKKGKLLVMAVRENSPGTEMAYDLPLSFDLPGNVDPHKGHH